MKRVPDLNLSIDCVMQLFASTARSHGAQRASTAIEAANRALGFTESLTVGDELRFDSQQTRRLDVVGAPDTIRTCDLCLRRATLSDCIKKQFEMVSCPRNQIFYVIQRVRRKPNPLIFRKSPSTRLAQNSTGDRFRAILS